MTRTQVAPPRQTCSKCDSPMVVIRRDMPYVMGGFPHVTLMGMDVDKCEDCGQEAFKVPAISLLHSRLGTLDKEKAYEARFDQHTEEWLVWPPPSRWPRPEEIAETVLWVSVGASAGVFLPWWVGVIAAPALAALCLIVVVWRARR